MQLTCRVAITVHTCTSYMYLETWLCSMFLCAGTMAVSIVELLLALSAEHKLKQENGKITMKRHVASFPGIPLVHESPPCRYDDPHSPHILRFPGGTVPCGPAGRPEGGPSHIQGQGIALHPSATLTPPYQSAGIDHTAMRE